MTRTEVINIIAAERGAKTYLEIGTNPSGRNYEKINVPSKMGVSPGRKNDELGIVSARSDEFFESDDAKGMVFDIIFIDGDHEYHQAKRDVKNAQKFLSPTGVLVIHDVNPARADMVSEDRPKIGTQWCGEVYKVFVELRKLKTWTSFCIADDHGIGVAYKAPNPDQFKGKAPKDWKEFNAKRNEYLRVLPASKSMLLDALRLHSADDKN